MPQKKIEGYAAIWDSPTFIPSAKRGGFIEVVRRGAFRGSLESRKDVLAVIDHDPDRILGRTSAGNLKLREDHKGLFYSIEPADTSYARDLFQNIAAGNFRGSSFSFAVDKDGDHWTHEDGQLKRELRSVSLSDVSVVVQPAYPQTSVAARSRDLKDLEQRLARHERLVEHDRERAEEEIRDKLQRLARNQHLVDIDRGKALRDLREKRLRLIERTI